LQFLAVQLPTWSGEARGALDFDSLTWLEDEGLTGFTTEKKWWFLIQ
jgi:hypothetical protein